MTCGAFFGANQSNQILWIVIFWLFEIFIPYSVVATSVLVMSAATRICLIDSESINTIRVCECVGMRSSLLFCSDQTMLLGMAQYSCYRAFAAWLVLQASCVIFAWILRLLTKHSRHGCSGSGRPPTAKPAPSCRALCALWANGRTLDKLPVST